MKQKIIKTPLVVGQEVICNLSGVEVYRGIVTDVLDEVTVQIQRTDDKKGQGMNDLWVAKRNLSGSWDGCIERSYSYSGFYYHSTPGRQYNRKTGGSWLYSEVIEDWKSILG